MHCNRLLLHAFIGLIVGTLMLSGMNKAHRTARSAPAITASIALPRRTARRVDMRRLAHAVSMAETSGCTAGTALSKNNCHGIMACTATGCTARTFGSQEESFTTFEELWLRAYGDRFPTVEDAQRYTGNPDPSRWYGVVTLVYNNER